MTVLKKELLKKPTALKKLLLRKRDRCVEVVTLKQREEIFPKIKLSWKSNIYEKGNRHLKKKIPYSTSDYVYSQTFQ